MKPASLVLIRLVRTNQFDDNQVHRHVECSPAVVSIVTWLTPTVAIVTATTARTEAWAVVVLRWGGGGGEGRR